MIRNSLATLAAALVALAAFAQPAPAPSPPPATLGWKKGDVLTYRAEHSTHVIDKVGDSQVETKTRLAVTKKWTVLDVDERGTATVQLSIAALKMENTPPGGEPIKYDSANPKESTPGLAEQMGKYVGVPVATLRVDTLGRVLEVKESKFGPATRFESEPPFGGIVPGVAVQSGQGWDRAYKVTLGPPLGTGEKYDATQTYAVKSMENNRLTVAVTTAIKNLPAAAADRLPLLEFMPQGEVVFDVPAGRMRSSSMKVEQEVKDHQGEGGSYKFTATWLEQLVE